MEDSDMRARHSKRFPNELRESVARRYLATDATLKELAEEIGSSHWSVGDWVRQYQARGTVGKHKKTQPTQTDKRSPEEKLRLLLQFKTLEDSARGDFVRREGVHDGDLERWEAEALGGLRGGDSSDVQARRIRELERDSDKKDKRLKEATALLALQKKVHALWGDEDDDTNKNNGAS